MFQQLFFEKGKVMAVTESPQEALARIQGSFGSKNDGLVLMAFSERGLAIEDIFPRVNVLTFRAWQAKGRRVAKGAISVPVTTWIPCGEKSPEDGEKKDKPRMRPKTASLFHISQTVPADTRGEKPAAWDNPALVREGTYPAESVPVSPAAESVGQPEGSGSFVLSN